MITTVLADDHPIVRQGLRSLLEASGRCRIEGEAANGLTAIELITELQPDLAVLDVQLPDLDGLEVARRTREQSPKTRVLILSMHSEEAFVLDALANGAMGYVLKESATTDLLAAIDAAMTGRRYLSAPLADRAVEAYANQGGTVSRHQTATTC